MPKRRVVSCTLTKGEQTVTIPKGAQPLSVNMYQGSPTLSLLTEAISSYESRTFLLVESESLITQQGLGYIETMNLEGGLWHLFEVYKNAKAALV